MSGVSPEYEDVAYDPARVLEIEPFLRPTFHACMGYVNSTANLLEPFPFNLPCFPDVGPVANRFPQGGDTTNFLEWDGRVPRWRDYQWMVKSWRVMGAVVGSGTFLANTISRIAFGANDYSDETAYDDPRDRVRSTRLWTSQSRTGTSPGHAGDDSFLLPERWDGWLNGIIESTTGTASGQIIEIALMPVRRKHTIKGCK